MVTTLTRRSSTVIFGTTSAAQRPQENVPRVAQHQPGHSSRPMTATSATPAIWFLSSETAATADETKRQPRTARTNPPHRMVQQSAVSDAPGTAPQRSRGPDHHHQPRSNRIRLRQKWLDQPKPTNEPRAMMTTPPMAIQTTTMPIQGLMTALILTMPPFQAANRERIAGPPSPMPLEKRTRLTLSCFLSVTTVRSSPGSYGQTPRLKAMTSRRACQGPEENQR